MALSPPMLDNSTGRKWTAYFLLLCGLSMSVGWRIRGQFGHEIGAAMPGALVGMSVALGSGRPDWIRRVHYFALFGALGWAFGGSMSYMKVVAFCHSTDSATVLYGFAAMFLLGFLWASLGAAGIALPATLDSRRLAELFPAMATLSLAWLLQGIITDIMDMRGVNLDWYDTDWIDAGVAVAAMLLLALARRRIDLGTSLILHMAVGWWIAFLVLVVGLGLRLNPPRGDNWAGCVGLVGGAIVFCRGQRLTGVIRAALIGGTLGGMGFCLGQMYKLVLIKLGIETDIHAMMEWSHGLFFGLATAFVFISLARSSPQPADAPIARWIPIYALMFVFWVVLYGNFIKCPEQWQKSLPAIAKGTAYGLPLAANLTPSKGWFGWVDMILVAIGVVMLIVLVRRRTSRLLFAEGQFLLVTFLWAITVTSFAHEVTGFGSGEILRIQIGITLHAVLCTLIALWPARLPRRSLGLDPTPRPQQSSLHLAGLGLAACLAMVFAGWGVKQSLFGNAFPGHAGLQIRFGPNNTNNKK